MILRIVSKAGLLAAAAICATGAHAATVLDVTGYNAVVLGNYTGRNSDIEGALAAGGNVTLTNYGVGSRLDASARGTNTLIAGGNLSYTNGQLFQGNAVVGGTATTVGFNVQNGTLASGSPVDFAAEGAALQSLAATLGATAANGTVANNYGSLLLTGSQSGLNVFSLTASDLASAHGLTIAAAAGSKVLVNVAGSSASWQNMGINLGGIASGDVLFNFFDATDLSLSGIGINGSVLAPNAAVTFNNGQLNGLLVAGSFDGTGELHNTGYTGGLFDTPAGAVPEPETWAMMLLGFGVLGVGMRSRSRRAVRRPRIRVVYR